MKNAFLPSLLGLAFSASCFATVLTGTGGSGVIVGGSSLIGSLHYSDAFTTGLGGAGTYRVGADVSPWTADDIGSEALPNTYGNPARSWPISFSMNQDTPSSGFSPTVASPYPGSSGAGSSTGLIQAGGSDWAIGIGYGLANNFVMQFDAVAATDRATLIFGAGATGGATGIDTANTLSVFIRPSGVALYRSDTLTEVATGITTGPTGGIWSNYAAHVDLTLNTIQLYQNETALGGVINVGTLMPDYLWDASAVGFGVRSPGGDRIWADNFQIGAAIPEPSSGFLLGLGTVMMGLKRSRRHASNSTHAAAVN